MFSLFVAQSVHWNRNARTAIGSNGRRAGSTFVFARHSRPRRRTRSPGPPRSLTGSCCSTLGGRWGMGVRRITYMEAGTGFVRRQAPVATSSSRTLPPCTQQRTGGCAHSRHGSGPPPGLAREDCQQRMPTGARLSSGNNLGTKKIKTATRPECHAGVGRLGGFGFGTS